MRSMKIFFRHAPPSVGPVRTVAAAELKPDSSTATAEDILAQRFDQQVRLRQTTGDALKADDAPGGNSRAADQPTESSTPSPTDQGVAGSSAAAATASLPPLVSHSAAGGSNASGSVTAVVTASAGGSNTSGGAAGSSAGGSSQTVSQAGTSSTAANANEASAGPVIVDVTELLSYDYERRIWYVKAALAELKRYWRQREIERNRRVNNKQRQWNIHDQRYRQLRDQVVQALRALLPLPDWSGVVVEVESEQWALFAQKLMTVSADASQFLAAVRSKREELEAHISTITEQLQSPSLEMSPEQLQHLQLLQEDLEAKIAQRLRCIQQESLCSQIKKSMNAAAALVPAGQHASAVSTGSGDAAAAGTSTSSGGSSAAAAGTSSSGGSSAAAAGTSSSGGSKSTCSGAAVAGVLKGISCVSAVSAQCRSCIKGAQEGKMQEQQLLRDKVADATNQRLQHPSVVQFSSRLGELSADLHCLDITHNFHMRSAKMLCTITSKLTELLGGDPNADVFQSAAADAAQAAGAAGPVTVAAPASSSSSTPKAKLLGIAALVNKEVSLMLKENSGCKPKTWAVCAINEPCFRYNGPTDMDVDGGILTLTISNKNQSATVSEPIQFGCPPPQKRHCPAAPAVPRPA